MKISFCDDYNGHAFELEDFCLMIWDKTNKNAFTTKEFGEFSPVSVKIICNPEEMLKLKQMVDYCINTKSQD